MIQDTASHDLSTESYFAGDPVVGTGSARTSASRLVAGADRRARKLLEGLPAGIVVLDGAGCVQQCNAAAEDFLGKPLLGQDWRCVVTRVVQPRWDDGHDISLISGRRVNISTQALEDEPGQFLLITDVTQTRQLQEQVAHHKRLATMGEMAASLAHQIRTPLSSAILYLSNLATNARLEEATRQRFTKKSLAQLKHLEQLVKDMLLFARAGTFDVEHTLVRELIESLAQELEPQVRAAEFTLEIAMLTPQAVISANRTALLSVLLNLANNAMQAAGKQGWLRIETCISPENELQIEFTDNGPGIPVALRDSVFEPFVTTRSQGCGLGLAVAHAVIGAHHGRITLETTAPAGARFRIRLPLVSLGPLQTGPAFGSTGVEAAMQATLASVAAN